MFEPKVQHQEFGETNHVHFDSFFDSGGANREAEAADAPHHPQMGGVIVTSYGGWSHGRRPLELPVCLDSTYGRVGDANGEQ